FLAALLIAGTIVRLHKDGVRTTARSLVRTTTDVWPVLLFAAVGLLMIAVMLLQMRYVAAYILLLFAALLWGLTLPSATWPPEWSRVLLLTVAVAFGVTFLPGLAT